MHPQTPLVESEPSQKAEKFMLSRFIRVVIFFGFVALSIVMSGDNGVVSSSSQMIKKDLGLSDSEFGIFGSLPSTGRIFGSLLFMGLLSADNRKYITVGALLVNGGAFFIYLFTKNKWILLGVRFTIGTVRVYPHIYIPVWVDQFGIKPLKTIMMTIINITSPLGQVVGYSIGTFNVPEKWPYSFALIGTIIISLGSIIICSPAKYFDKRYGFLGYDEGKPELVQLANDRTGNSIFGTGAAQKKKEKHEGGNMCAILKSITYLASAYTRANLLFIFQVNHLFITEYCRNGLGINDRKLILSYYGTASLFGPLAGGAFGGIITTKVGGYEQKSSVWVCFAFGILTALSTIPVMFAKDIIFLSIGLFSFFFNASAILPTIVGYIISSVPKEHKGAASSLNMLITTLLGNLPGPIVYGFINDKMGEKSPTFAWKCVTSYYYLGFFIMLIACLFRYRDLSNATEPPIKEDTRGRGSKTSETMADVAAGEHYALDDKTRTNTKPAKDKDTELQDKD